MLCYNNVITRLHHGLIDRQPITSRLDSEDEYRFQAASEFCPHHVGHYLGMDTHDTHLVSRGLGLHPGMVITVEPGIYISADNSEVPER